MYRSLALLAVCGAVFAAAAFDPLVLHEAIATTPSSMGWTEGAVSPDSTTLHVSVFVKQPEGGVAALTDALMAMSDPDSPKYGHHMSNDAVHNMVAPAPEAVSAVKAWLQAAAGPDAELTTSPNSDIVSVDLPVRVAERLLGAEYRSYTRQDSAVTLTRTLSYSLPASIRHHVDMVSPTVRFPHVFSTSNVMAFAEEDSHWMLHSGSGLGVNPSSLRTLLKVGDAQGKSSDNLQAAMGFLNQFVAPSDVETFFEKYYPTANGRTFNVIGPNTASDPGIEASLDVEYIMALGSNVPTTFWSKAGQQPGNPENEPFLAWLEDVAKTSDANLPKVFSASYGDNEGTVNNAYALRVNTEFQKLGARGVSIMFSSGDGGVGGGQPSECTNFIPTFPAGSPYVTAVGGSNGDGSSAASLSSGGFANYFARPSFQDDAVTGYFKVATNLPDSSLYNHTGAGIPDVAAPAEGFTIVYGGFSTSVAGTSCAAPTFTGVVSLVNDLRLEAGKSPLGYLNPLIYKHPEIFQDITTGDNPGCGTRGFTAAAGWDPVTGFGLPDYQKWSTLAMSLQ